MALGVGDQVLEQQSGDAPVVHGVGHRNATWSDEGARPIRRASVSAAARLRLKKRR
jgi:hypothetical protein